MEIIGQQYELESELTDKEIIDMGKKLMKMQGGITPQFFLEKRKKNGSVMITSMLLEYEDPEKMVILEKVREIVSNSKAERVFLLNDGWASVMKKGDMRGKRERVIIVNIFNKSMKNTTYTVNVNGTKENLKFGKPAVMKDFNTIWNPYIELDGAIEKQKKTIDDFKGEEDGV